MDVEDVPRYHRRMPEVNEAIVATYLAGGNTRRIRGALQPLLKAAPLSKSAVSRVIATRKDGLEAWRTRSLADLDVIYVYLDGLRSACAEGRQGRDGAVLGVVAVRTDGSKHLLALELCSGESFAAWKGCLDDLIARRLRAPMLPIIDGNVGLRRAVGESWPRAAVQRCCVHKLRNLERKAPKHVLAEIRDDFHRIAYATSAEAARAAYATFERAWGKRCPGVVASLREGGDELLTFFTSPKAQWKTTDESVNWFSVAQRSTLRSGTGDPDRSAGHEAASPAAQVALRRIRRAPLLAAPVPHRSAASSDGPELRRSVLKNSPSVLAPQSTIVLAPIR
jgi:putative transposase